MVCSRHLNIACALISKAIKAAYNEYAALRHYFGLLIVYIQWANCFLDDPARDKDRVYSSKANFFPCRNILFIILG